MAEKETKIKRRKDAEVFLGVQRSSREVLEPCGASCVSMKERQQHPPPLPTCEKEREKKREERGKEGGIEEMEGGRYKGEGC